MSRPRDPLPAPFTGRPFRTMDALRAGLSESRLRAPDLLRPFHGVRMPTPANRPDPNDPTASYENLCRARRLTMRPDDVFSHVTACRLHGIPVPRRLRGDLVDVAGFRPAAAPHGSGVKGHRLTRGQTETTVVRGLPVIAPADAWGQLAPELTVRELVIAGDGLLRRNRPLCTPEQLAAAVARFARRRGYRKLIAALPHIRANTDSAAETELRLDAIAYGLPEPVVNHEIREGGRLVAIGDLAYPRYRVLLEYDGEQHRTDDRQYARDIDRLDDLAHLTWRVIRVNKSHTAAARAARFERVRAALIAAGWTPGTPA